MGNLSLRGLQMLQFKKTYAEAECFFSDIKIKPFGEGCPTPRETEAMQYNSKINRPGIYYDRLEMLAWVYTIDKKLFLIPARKFKDLLKKVGHIPLSAKQSANMEFVREFLTSGEEERYSYDRDWKINKKAALRLKRIQLLLDKSPEKDKKIEVDVQKYEEAFVHSYETTFCTCPICVALKEKMSANPITIPYDFDATPDKGKDIAISVIDTGWKIAALSEVG